jgi:hypothetical protein
MDNIHSGGSIKRTFIFSCDTFGGFRKTIDINSYESVEDIVASMVGHLRNHLQQGNLEYLVGELERITPRYHIHDFGFGDILLSARDYYICNHNCEGWTDNSTSAVGEELSRGSS